MRLDKFLKVSRLVKRRTVAAELCQAGQVKMNGQVAKAAAEVKIDAVLQLRFGNRLLSVRIKEVPLKAVPAQLADTLYEVLEDVSVEAAL